MGVTPSFQKFTGALKVRCLIMVVAASIVLVACGSSSTANTASVKRSTKSGTNSNGTYVVHAILSETGSASILGSRQAKALNLLAARINAKGGIDGHKIVMSIQDNQSKPSVSVSLATPLINKHVPFILNGSLTSVDKAVDALASSNGPFIYDLSPIEMPKPNSMIFAAGTPLKLDDEAYLNFLKSKGLTNIAIVTSTDASGVGGYNQLIATLKEPAFSSFHVVAHQTFDPTSVSVLTQLSVVKAAHPQAIIIWTTGSPLGVVLKGMSSLGMDGIPTITDNGDASYALLHHFASVLPKNLYFPTPPFYLPSKDISNVKVRAKIVAFDSAIISGGGHPSNPYGLSWDPAELLFGALDKLGINATAMQIKAYMQNLHNTPGIYGIYNMSKVHHHGLSVDDVIMTTWNGKSFVQASKPGGAAL